MKIVILKPCPFCGGPAKLLEDLWPRFVYCTVCNARTMNMPQFGDEGSKAAVESWNRRFENDARHRLEVHNIGNIDIPEGVTWEQFQAVMENVVDALEHTDRGESWPYEEAKA